MIEVTDVEPAKVTRVLMITGTEVEQRILKGQAAQAILVLMQGGAECDYLVEMLKTVTGSW